MNFIDTHTHLYSTDFDKDREDVIKRAEEAGIKEFVLPAIDSQTTQAMYDLEQKHPDKMHLMMGLHPVSVEHNYRDELNHVKEQFDKRDFYAVGEIGIDLHWGKSFLKEQREVFIEQIRLAKSKQLPIVIHCRKAFDEVFDVLEQENDSDLFGVFHCFSGTVEQAKRILGFGLKIGLGGILTFKNGKIDKFMSEIPMEEIVLETDAPYLAPHPYRGKRNESSYMIKVAERLAEIHDISLEEVAEITSANAKKVFNI